VAEKFAALTVSRQHYSLIFSRIISCHTQRVVATTGLKSRTIISGRAAKGLQLYRALFTDIMAISTSSIVSENILAIFNALHAKGQRASFAFGTDTKPYSGKQCLVYVVTFSDNTTWAMRIPVHSVHAGADTISNSVEHEVTILQTLQLRGFVWSPSLIGYDSTFDNQIQFPYIISSWVPGTQLRWNDNSPALREDRNKIIHQIAHMTIDLAKASHAQGKYRSSVCVNSG
jgi:hypothetical protein